MKRIYTVSILVILLTLVAQAHEFWLLPGNFFAQPGQVVPVDVLVGEHFNGEHSEAKKNRIVQFTHWYAGKKENLSPSLTEGHYGAVSFKLTTSGTHLVAFANTNKYLTMPADSFLLYLREDGLDNIIRLREQRHETTTRSREFYRRCVKTLIQAGPVNRSDLTFAQDTGMPLEIMPIQNPYEKKSGDWAEFRIVFEHKPLANALVRYWSRPNNVSTKTNNGKPIGLTEEQQRTDTQGKVRFRLKAGQNMISLVQMVPNATAQQADWQSYWGSLTFGCRK